MGSIIQLIIIVVGQIDLKSDFNMDIRRKGGRRGGEEGER